MGRILQRAVTDLGAKIEHHHLNGAYTLLCGADHILKCVFFCGIQQTTRGFSPLGFYVRNQCIEALCITAATQYDVIPFAGKTFAYRSPDTGTGTHNQTYWLHRTISLFKPGPRLAQTSADFNSRPSDERTAIG